MLMLGQGQRWLYYWWWFWQLLSLCSWYADHVDAWWLFCFDHRDLCVATCACETLDMACLVSVVPTDPWDPTIDANSITGWPVNRLGYKRQGIKNTKWTFKKHFQHIKALSCYMYCDYLFLCYMLHATCYMLHSTCYMLHVLWLSFLCAYTLLKVNPRNSSAKRSSRQFIWWRHQQLGKLSSMAAKEGAHSGKDVNDVHMSAKMTTIEKWCNWFERWPLTMPLEYFEIFTLSKVDLVDQDVSDGPDHLSKRWETGASGVPGRWTDSAGSRVA